MDQDAIASEVAVWISENCQNAKGVSVTADSELIDSGLLDSLDYLNMVSFLEDKFSTEIDSDAMIPDNFRTPKAIATLIV